MTSESERKDMIRYLRVFDIVLFGMFLTFGIIGLLTLAFVGIPGIMFVIPACLAFSYWFGKFKSADNLVREIEKDGKLDELMEDWHNGERYFNGRLICGKKYLMCRGSGLVNEIDDIVRVYPFNKKNGFAGDSYILRADTAEGKTFDLTFLSMKGKDDEDVRKLMKHIRSEASLF